MAFYFDLAPPFYFLKWNRFFSTFPPVLSESRHYFNYLLSREVCTNLQIKRFSLVKLWYAIWMYVGSEFQSNNIKKHPPHINSFWNCSSWNLLLIRLINFALIIAERFMKASKQFIVIPPSKPPCIDKSKSYHYDYTKVVMARNGRNHGK